MHDNKEDTPPSSINGDEITGMDEEGIYLEDMEELQFDEDMEQLDDQEEEYVDTEPAEDHAALVFDTHVGSVFCCDLHPNGKIAVTGGEDDKAYVWSVQDGQVLMVCTGHKDSVVFVGFSFDGVFLATADMSGLVKVWKCNLEDNEPWVVAFEYEVDDITWGKWHFGARVLICGTFTGHLFVLKIPSGEAKVLQGHSNGRVECAKLFHDGVRLAAGYADGTVKVWDLKTNSVIHQIPSSVHETRVTAVDTHPENNLMASISSDGKLVITTSVNGKVVGQVMADNELETVAFAEDPQLGLIALASLSGAVSIWDVARQMVRHHCAKAEDEIIAGVTNMVWQKTHLITGCLDGGVRIYEGRTGDRITNFTGHRSEILDLCINEKENIILTASDDGTARIFKYEVDKDKD